MSITESLGLLAAAAAAGAVNAVAGGGTIITFPTLLAIGTPPIVANATSTLALVIGTFGGAYGYRRHLAAVRPWLWRFLPPSILGGLIGSLLLIHTNDRIFSRLVPFLIFFATALFFAQGFFRKFASGGAPKPHALGIAILFQFAVSIYGGYFGAGIGILMLATLGFVGLGNIHEMNGLKTVLGSLINLIAATLFICAGLINWQKAGVMTAGSLAGYYAGSHFSQRIPQRWVRTIITAIGLALSLVTFYKEFVR